MRTIPPMSKSPPDPLSGRVFSIRGQRVILDADLARLYGTKTMAFNQAVRRNWKRFPPDFILQVSREEYANLISQTVISNAGGRGGRRKPALAFTEHAAIVVASILRSPRTSQKGLVSIFDSAEKVLGVNRAPIFRGAIFSRGALTGFFVGRATLYSP